MLIRRYYPDVTDREVGALVRTTLAGAPDCYLQDDDLAAVVRHTVDEPVRLPEVGAGPLLRGKVGLVRYGARQAALLR